MLGTYTFSGIIALFLFCLPISLLWIFIDKLLILIGQDPLISVEARKFTVWLIPSLFPFAILQLLTRYLLSQSLILPMLLSSVVVVLFHVPACWALVYGLKLGNFGAALAIGLSYTFNAILLGLYVKYSSACQKTRISLSSDGFPNIRVFLRFGIPSAFMICLSWWSYEIVILFSGLLPNPKLETSVLSISLTVSTLHYCIPYSFGAAVSTRVSNELGAGNAKAAQMAAWTAMVPGIGEAIIASVILLCSSSALGYGFGNVKEVVDYVKEMTPLICLSVFVESVGALFNGYYLNPLPILFSFKQVICHSYQMVSFSTPLGVARGSGWQHIGVYVNLGAFYLAGIPMAVFLGFVLHLSGKGLMIGLIVGLMIESTMLGLVTCFTNWQKQARNTREQIYAGRIPDDQ